MAFRVELGWCYPGIENSGAINKSIDFYFELSGGRFENSVLHCNNNSALREFRLDKTVYICLTILGVSYVIETQTIANNKRIMRKFAVAQSFLCYLEKYSKTSSKVFPVDDKEFKYLLCTLPILCTPVRV